MNPDMLTLYDMWEVVVPSFPPRSRLYPLAPLGLGSPVSESLTSYIARLAEAHSVPTGLFVAHELLPGYGHPYLFKNRTVLWFKHARAFNGVNDWARKMLAVVERLTTRQDLQFLTMLPWAKAVSTRGLLRDQRAWCPTCFEVGRQTGQVIYEPLLWALEVVIVCPLHGQPLQTSCPYCHQTLPWLEAYMRPGYCSRCKCWLGALSASPTTLSQGTKADLEWQLWVAKTMGDLLAIGPGLSSFPKWEQVSQGLTQVMNQLTTGKSQDFYRLLRTHNCRISSDRLWHWRTRQVLPELYWLLRLCYCLRIPLGDLLTGQVKTGGQLRTFVANERPGASSKSGPRNPEQIRQELEEILADLQEPPMSLNQIAKRLGYYGHGSLVRAFPELSRLIAERYRQHQIDTLITRRQENQRKIQQVLAELFQRGENPTQKRIAAELGRASLSSEEATLFRETLQELGKRK